MAEKTKAKADHPTYHHMVVKALGELAEKKGSSKIAIGKYVNANFDVKPNYNVRVKTALKKLLEIGTIVQSKGSGCTGSFKLADKKKAPKKAEKKVKKATKAKKSPTKKPLPKPKVAKSPKKAAVKGRGRPKKAEKAPAKPAAAADGVKKGRGRPKKQ